MELYNFSAPKTTFFQDIYEGDTFYLHNEVTPDGITTIYMKGFCDGYPKAINLRTGEIVEMPSTTSICPIDACITPEPSVRYE